MSSERSSPLVPIALAAALVGGAIVWLHRPPRVSDEPLAACPAGAFLAAKIDVAKIRATPLAPLAEQALAGLVPEAARACDLPGRLESAAIVVPEGDERSDLGFALKLRMTPDELAKCARAAAGDGVPTETRGGFAFVAAKLGHADTLAAAENGLVLVGERAWVEAMAAAASGRAPSVVSSPPHDATLRGLGARTVSVSISLPKATRARIRREMETEIATGGRRPMEGVLGVEAAGAGVDVRADADTDATVVLRCDTKDACTSVKSLVESKKAGWSSSVAVRFLGLAAAAESIAVTQTGTRVVATARLPTSDLKSALERALAFRRSRSEPEPMRPPAPVEVVRDAGSPDASARDR